MSEKFEPSCSHCRYFKPVDSQTGACHRFPPVFAGESSPRETHHWRFPMVSIHAWCGECLPAHADQLTSAGATI